MDHGNDRDRLQAELEARGIQATSQRMRIAELLFARDQHLTAEQIIATLAGQGTRVSKATVYNTLNLFAEKGLLRDRKSTRLNSSHSQISYAVFCLKKKKKKKKKILK